MFICAFLELDGRKVRASASLRVCPRLYALHFANPDMIHDFGLLTPFVFHLAGLV